MNFLALAELEERRKRAERQRMDHEWRKAQPGYPEYASGAIDDLATVDTLSSLGLPVVSDAADTALATDAAMGGRWGDAAIYGAAAAVPFVAGPALKAGVDAIGRRIGDTAVGNIPMDPELVELEAMRQALPGQGQTAWVDSKNTQPGQVSTRYPTAVARQHDPSVRHDLTVSYQSARKDPAAVERAAELVSQYPGMKSRARTPQGRIDDYVKFQQDNLNRLYEEIPSSVRDQTKQWYVGANRLANEAAELHGLTPEQTAGVYAALSPQKDWYQNVSLGDRVMDIAKNAGDHPWTAEMQETLDRIAPGQTSKPAKQAMSAIVGKRYSDLSDPNDRALWIRVYDQTYNPSTYPKVTPTGERGDLMLAGSGAPRNVQWNSVPTIGNAVRILDDPSLANVSANVGQQHKVRSFYNNIRTPDSLRGDVTIDTHAVAAGNMMPYAGGDVPVAHNFGGNSLGSPGPVNSSITGNQGTYGINAEAYRRAAADQGVLPREMQSITWEGVRGLFTNKSPKVKAAAREIWGDYQRGLITQTQAQDQIFALAGGVDLPTWMD